ncbi:hypothetical protein PWT90_02704 [Aphanocladium album]|nr:hypothetical protein PWT90_02704 [Aphanocladium album]
MRNKQHIASDLSNLDSIAVAYAPFQSPRSKSPLRQQHVDSQSPAWTSTTQDPYYSNEDIEILHEIVSIAQEKLEDPNGPRPLPATALFKAYDEVLPKHGVDPDDENHLSRLIFRVGGEKGSSSLSEKFQAVLASMGISLEYGDGSSLSQRVSRSSLSSVDDPSVNDMQCQGHALESPQPDDRGFEKRAAPRSVAEDAKDNSVDLEWKLGEELLHAAPIFKSNPQPTARNITEDLYLSQTSRRIEQGMLRHPLAKPAITRPEPPEEDIEGIPEPEDEMPKWRSALSRPPVLAILDRWRIASKSRKSQGPLPPPLEDNRDLPASEVEHAQASETREAVPQVLSFPASTFSPLRKNPQTVETKVRRPEPKSISIPVPTVHHELALPQEEATESHGNYTAMLNRAGRARQIYLASKAFNHWAERTAARLEKEAVARRHMIRFRCFRGWGNAPNARSPAVDNLRAATAVQKLRRAIACQEEQLRAAASTINAAHRVQKAKRALSQWRCSTAQQNIQRETAYRAKRGIVSSWCHLTNMHKEHAEFTAKSRQNFQKRQLIHLWAGKAQQAERQYAISKHVGLVRPMFSHLAAWWDHTEVQKRAEIFRANLTWKRAHSALDTWNLRARAQAFVWRTDYQSATTALDKWAQVIRNVRMQESRAALAAEQLQFSTTLVRLEQSTEYSNKLQFYAQRARLFIMASKFLRVLDRAYEAKKNSRKEEIRQQLRARYKEVSSSRKKRQFHAALNVWRSSAARHAAVAAEAKEHAEVLDHTVKLNAVNTWIGATSQHEEQLVSGQKHAINHVLNNWGDLSYDLAQQDAHSWDLWMQRKQRQALKSWSISSLQGSGQAHTAMMVKQRHQADGRNRAFQSWRHSCQNIQATDAGYMSATPASHIVNARRSWRTLSMRRPTAKQEAPPQFLSALSPPAATLDTPTRWTGRPLAMPSTLAKPMPAVREADEQSGTASSSGDEHEIRHDLAASTKNPQLGFHRSLVLRSGKIASTTPRAPVPANLRRSTQMRNSVSHKSITSRALEQSFQPRRSVIRQPETSDRKPADYVDSAIQTGVPVKPGPSSQRHPAVNWRGPATPSRQSFGYMGSNDYRAGASNWIQAASTAPQPSRFSNHGAGGSRARPGANE